MVLTRLKKSFEKKQPPAPPNNDPAILIVEDDIDQLNMFVSFAISTLKSLLSDEGLSNAQHNKIAGINIIKVSEIETLKRAIVGNTNIIAAILDCNIPDAAGLPATDQYVKNKNLLVTGQHKSVDLLAAHSPGTPITLTSSMGRFQTAITKYYQDNKDLKIEFFSKDKGSEIKSSLKRNLRHYLSRVS